MYVKTGTKVQMPSLIIQIEWSEEDEDRRREREKEGRENEEGSYCWWLSSQYHSLIQLFSVAYYSLNPLCELFSVLVKYAHLSHSSLTVVHLLQQRRQHSLGALGWLHNPSFPPSTDHVFTSIDSSRRDSKHDSPRARIGLMLGMCLIVGRIIEEIRWRN